jgi:hypothetical protein
LVTNLGFEIRDLLASKIRYSLPLTSTKYAPSCWINVADDLTPCNRAYLLVDESTVVSDGEFEDISFDQLRFTCIVCRYWVSFAVWADHCLTVKDAFYYFTGDIF